MNKKEYLNIVRKEIKYVFDRDRIEQELSEHLQDSILDLTLEGYSYEEAEKQAIAQMGDPIEIGQLLNKEHHPLIGYLYKITQVIMVLILLCCLIPGLYFVIELKNMSVPQQTQCVEKIVLDYKVELPGHKFIFDNICIDRNGCYKLTYRCFIKYSYSRSKWGDNIQSIKDTNNNLISGANGKFADTHERANWVEFELPENNIILIELYNNQVITINLEDYRIN